MELLSIQFGCCCVSVPVLVVSTICVLVRLSCAGAIAQCKVDIMLGTDSSRAQCVDMLKPVSSEKAADNQHNSQGKIPNKQKRERETNIPTDSLYKAATLKTIACLAVCIHAVLHSISRLFSLFAQFWLLRQDLKIDEICV